MLQELAQEAGAVLGYEIERFKGSPKAAVLLGNQFSAERKSLPGDFVSLAGFVAKPGDYKIIYEDRVRSTNDMAGELIKKGYGHGTVIVANGQSHGKGRSGKVWFSPPGLNIYMTIVVMPKQESLAEKIPLINLVASLSVANALRNQTGLEVGLKWPNTLAYSNKDLGGILSESLISGNQLYGLSTGIGVNVNQEAFPEDLKAGSTSLYLETGKRQDRGKLVIEILKKFDQYYNLFLTNSRAVIDEWMLISKTINSNVRVITERGELQGRAVGLNDQGMLLLELPDHQVLSLASGEIVSA
jgi:BirA family biotin operon repressor/biotin-[acetyl-CoA-carboxylase] ligase